MPPLTDADRQACEQRFVVCLRKLLQEQRPMAPAEMAALFEDDGHLGSEMRSILLEQGRAA